MIVPIGHSKEEIKQRESIISNVYRDFYAKTPSKKVYNQYLKAYINIRYISITETIRHASKSFLSTLAVLQLESVLKCATQYGKPTNPKKGVKNQEEFSKIIEMRHNLPGIGIVKLTVGIKKTTGDYVQYCLTAINT